MPRQPRAIVGGLVYHILNRANARMMLFKKAEDYLAFEKVLEEAHERYPVRILGYCVMPNHWHLAIWPRAGEEEQVTRFMRWLTATHSRRWHEHRHSSGTGHVYQGRYKSFPVQEDAHLLTMLRYVERNALRAGLVRKAEDWQWSSLWRWYCGERGGRALLSDWPIAGNSPRPRNWVRYVNEPMTQAEEEAMRRSLRRGCPLGQQKWMEKVAGSLGLGHTLRSVGRPRTRESAK